VTPDVDDNALWERVQEMGAALALLATLRRTCRSWMRSRVPRAKRASTLPRAIPVTDHLGECWCEHFETRTRKDEASPQSIKVHRAAAVCFKRLVERGQSSHKHQCVRCGWVIPWRPLGKVVCYPPPSWSPQEPSADRRSVVTRGGNARAAEHRDAPKEANQTETGIRAVTRERRSSMRNGFAITSASRASTS